MPFDESKHPRDNDGKFTESEKRREAVKKYSDTPEKDLETQGIFTREAESINELLGEEFKGVKGQSAINKLMQEKRGHVKGAFHREDIGDIDLLWGNDYLGLQHILKRREEQGIDINEFLKGLSEVVEQGEFKQKNERGNFEFWKSGKMVVIAPEYQGHKITYILTAYKRQKK